LANFFLAKWCLTGGTGIVVVEQRSGDTVVVAQQWWHIIVITQQWWHSSGGI